MWRCRICVKLFTLCNVVFLHRHLIIQITFFLHTSLALDNFQMKLIYCKIILFLNFSFTTHTFHQVKQLYLLDQFMGSFMVFMNIQKIHKT